MPLIRIPCLSLSVTDKFALRPAFDASDDESKVKKPLELLEHPVCVAFRHIVSWTAPLKLGCRRNPS